MGDSSHRQLLAPFDYEVTKRTHQRFQAAAARHKADHWRIPEDIAERGIAYDAPSRPKDFGIRTLSTLDLDRQVSSDGATWLDREMVSDKRMPMRELGFGREAREALLRRVERLVEMGRPPI